MSGTPRTSPRVMTFDIETAPATALVFGQWKQNIGNIQIVKDDRVIAFAAKWHGDKRILFHSEYHDGHEEMVRAFNALLDEADIVIHFNGATFDMPWMRREAALLGLTPASPVQEIDLLKVAKSRFRFMSNKLENLARMFAVGAKMSTGGFGLWRDIEVGDDAARAAAWSKMRRYNKQDVIVTEALYDRILPWIHNHPHVGLYTNDPDCCSNCGGNDLRREGYRMTRLGKYPRYQCKGCGSWGQSKRSVLLANERGVG